MTDIIAARALTPLEVQDRLLTTAVNIADEYAADDDLSTEEKCHGVAFSLLAALDGTRDLPPMEIITRPPQAAIDVSIEENEDYIPAGVIVNSGFDMHKRYSVIRQEVIGALADEEELAPVDEDALPF